MENRLQGKRILITGGSAGIGEACAERFAAAGANLILCARRIARLRELQAGLVERHQGCLLYTSDAADE